MSSAPVSHTCYAHSLAGTAILALAKDSAETVRCEAIAALANLAVNGVCWVHQSMIVRAQSVLHWRLVYAACTKLIVADENEVKIAEAGALELLLTMVVSATAYLDRRMLARQHCILSSGHQQHYCPVNTPLMRVAGDVVIGDTPTDCSRLGQSFSES